MAITHMEARLPPNRTKYWLILLLALGANTHLLVSNVQAQNYGAGPYGGGVYSVGEVPVAAPTRPLGPDLGLRTSPANKNLLIIATSTSVSTSFSTKKLFTRELNIGSTGEDVQRLQIYLNNHGFILAKSGPGSPGMETSFFGRLTFGALVRLQKANSLLPATGNFGPRSRALLNKEAVI